MISRDVYFWKCHFFEWRQKGTEGEKKEERGEREKRGTKLFSLREEGWRIHMFFFYGSIFFFFCLVSIFLFFFFAFLI